MKRKPTDPDADSLDIASLRASLMGGKTQDGKKTRTGGTSEVAVEPPGAEDVLRSSPNVVRLCESYDQNRSRSRQQRRIQLVGLGGMVSAILAAVTVLFRQGRVGSDIVYQVLAAAIGATIFAIVLLVTLRRRDHRRIRDLQGDRLVRAVRLKCALPSEKVEAYVGQGRPAQRFFECYEVWCDMSGTKTGARTSAAAGTGGHRP